MPASLGRENDRGDCIRALQQQPRDYQAWDAPQPPAAKQPRLDYATKGSAFSCRAPLSTDIGSILQINPLHAKPAVLSQFEERARSQPLLWKLFLQLLLNEGGLDEVTYKRVCSDSLTRRANLINIMFDEHPNNMHDLLLLVTVMGVENVISALALVERGVNQIIFMREPSRQLEQRTYVELVPVIKSRSGVRIHQIERTTDDRRSPGELITRD